MVVKMQGKPWMRIWVQPRDTIRKIVAVNPKAGLPILCALNGFPTVLGLAQNLSLAALIPTWSIVLAAIILSVFVGYISIAISTWLLHITGQWLKGAGTFQTIRAAVAWSNAPNILTSLTWLVLLGVFGGEVFCRGFAETTFIGYQAGVIFLLFLVQSIASIWGLIILLQALGEVQGFSVWRALLNVIIPFVIVVGIGWLVMGILGTNKTV